MKAKNFGWLAMFAVGLVVSASSVRAQQTVTIASWGGSFQEAQRKAWFSEVEKELGIRIIEDTTSGIADVRAQVASGNPTWDLVQQGNWQCATLEKEGKVEPLSPEILKIPGIAADMKGTGWISNIVYSMVIAWSDKAYPGKKPGAWSDLWDIKTFPGVRGMRRAPYYTLEAALIADGVPMDKLYPLDVDRAFKKLEKIKKDIGIWWGSGAQSVQILKDGEVDLEAIWNGRARGLSNDGAPVSYTLNQQIILTDCWVVPKGAKNKELAMKALAIMSRADVQARISNFIDYAPANVLAFDTGVIPDDVARRLPNHPDNAKKGFVLNAAYWAENLDALTRRFDLFVQQ